MKLVLSEVNGTSLSVRLLGVSLLPKVVATPRVSAALWATTAAVSTVRTQTPTLTFPPGRGHLGRTFSVVHYTNTTNACYDTRLVHFCSVLHHAFLFPTLPFLSSPLSAQPSNVSSVLSQSYVRTHTHTHTHIYIYIYIYICVCVCV